MKIKFAVAIVAAVLAGALLSGLWHGAHTARAAEYAPASVNPAMHMGERVHGGETEITVAINQGRHTIMVGNQTGTTVHVKVDGKVARLKTVLTGSREYTY